MSRFGDSVALTYTKLTPGDGYQRAYAVRCGGNLTEIVVQAAASPGQGLRWIAFVAGKQVGPWCSTRFSAADGAMRRRT